MDVKFNPLKGCPMCNSDNLESDLHFYEEDVIRWGMVCHNCGYKWEDTYTYSHSMDVETGQELVYKQ